MIPAPNTLTQVDNLPGEEIEFGIGDPRFVMQTQADLYSDVTTAIIREYSTNAWDAHVMAGHTDPIEVFLPSIMNPHFIVRDHGVGMDMDTFRTIYTQFGISDKRKRRDTNGQLGYGSKSGVAYTTSFQVTSVRNGHKVVGVVMRKPDWSIVLKVVSQVKTDEPNGTEIRIPVHNVDEFNHKAREFYKFWLPGRVLVNCTAPDHYVGKKIADNLYYSADWGTSYVVMGNVAYRIANPEALFRNTKMNRLNFVAYVDDFKTEDGAQPVEFTPSREDLKYTERTKETLQAIVNQFETDIIATAQAEISKAETHADAFLAWKKWVDVLGRPMFDDLQYKGDKLEPEFAFNGIRYQPSSYRNSAFGIRSWSVDVMPNTMVVTEFDISMSSAVKRKAREFAKMKDWKHNYILFTADKASDIKSVWIKRDQFVKWAGLKAALPKKPRTAGGSNSNTGRISGSWDYCIYDGTRYTVAVEKPLPKNVNNIYHISVHDSKRYKVCDIMNHLAMTDAVVLLVPANRLPKLLRENPSIKSFTEYARSKVVVDSETLLSDDAKTVLSIDYRTRRWISRMDVSKIDDPEISRLGDLIKRETELTKEYEKNLVLANYTGLRYTVSDYTPEDKDYINEEYPLLASLSYYKMHPDVYVYVNAKYQEKENKK